MAITTEIRQHVIQRAKARCEYCQAQQILVVELQIDHIKPVSAGGTDEIDNLCVACFGCNSRKSDAQTAIDPITKQETPLFNPRIDKWDEHFTWNEAGIQLIGLTPIGRATIQRLGINRENAVEARTVWVEVGWHPPK